MGTTSFGTVPFALYSASSAKVDNKLDASDTTTMLKAYAKAVKVQSLETAVASKLTAADTLTMLAPYAKAAYTIDSSFFKSQLATKLSISDTINYTKQKYTDSAIAKKLNISDTIYYTKQNYTDSAFSKKFNSADTIYFTKQKFTDSAFSKKLNIADSAIYVTKSQLASYNFSTGGGGVAVDTSSLSKRINLKANNADLDSLTATVSSKLNIKDTAILLKKIDTASLSSRINLKLDISKIGVANGVGSVAETTNESARLAIPSLHQPDGGLRRRRQRRTLEDVGDAMDEGADVLGQGYRNIDGMMGAGEDSSLLLAREFLSRLLLVLACFVLLCLLLF
jgi:hypothetical protein